MAAVRKRSGRVWLVWGQCGEYEDHRDWVVCWYADEASAHRHAELAGLREREIRLWRDADGFSTHRQDARYVKKCSNVWDGGRMSDAGEEVLYCVGWCDAGQLLKKAIRKS